MTNQIERLNFTFLCTRIWNPSLLVHLLGNGHFFRLANFGVCSLLLRPGLLMASRRVMSVGCVGLTSWGIYWVFKSSSYRARESGRLLVLKGNIGFKKRTFSCNRRQNKPRGQEQRFICSRCTGLNERMLLFDLCYLIW